MRPEPSKEQVRDCFEERVFARHFISTIVRTGRGGPLELMPDPKKVQTKDELLRKDEKGNYVDEHIRAMWFGWASAANVFLGLNFDQPRGGGDLK